MVKSLPDKNQILQVILTYSKSNRFVYRVPKSLTNTEINTQLGGAIVIFKKLVENINHLKSGWKNAKIRYFSWCNSFTVKNNSASFEKFEQFKSVAKWVV